MNETETNPLVIEDEIDLPPATTWDLPIVMNDRVEAFISYFQGRGRKAFERYLARSKRYIPMMQKVLREHNLPEDLVYLAMIESGFNPKAKSRAEAVGLWQFMQRTGNMYGLRVTYWVDERRDPEKATVAAARHLRDLYDELQNWYLAAASYNAGIGKIRRAMKMYRTEDFWEMQRAGWYLKPETKGYVPKLIAAALIAKEPEKYGFTNIEYEPVVETEKVIVRKPTDLRELARRIGMKFDDLWYLNPELRRHLTPPDTPEYSVRVPKVVAAAAVVALQAMPAARVTAYHTVRVRPGDTMGSIARRYRTTVDEIKMANGISTTRLRAGQPLLVPRFAADGGEPVSPRRPTVQAKGPSQSRPAADGVIRVRRGDTLEGLAKAHAVSVSDLMSWNGLASHRIVAGQRLRVVAPPELRAQSRVPSVQSASSRRPYVQYRVRRGDTLTGIARRHSTSVRQLLELNNLAEDDSIYPGDRIRVPRS